MVVCCVVVWCLLRTSEVPRFVCCLLRSCRSRGTRLRNIREEALPRALPTLNRYNLDTEVIKYLVVEKCESGHDVTITSLSHKYDVIISVTSLQTSTLCCTRLAVLGRRREKEGRCPCTERLALTKGAECGRPDLIFFSWSLGGPVGRLVRGLLGSLGKIGGYASSINAHLLSVRVLTGRELYRPV